MIYETKFLKCARDKSGGKISFDAIRWNENHLGTLKYLFDTDFYALEGILKYWTTLKVEGSFVDVVRHGDDFELISRDKARKKQILLLSMENFRSLLGYSSLIREKKCRSIFFGLTPHDQIVVWCDNESMNQKLIKWQGFKVLPTILSSIHIKKNNNDTFVVTHSESDILYTLFSFFFCEVIKNSFSYGVWALDAGGGNITNMIKKENIVTVTTDFGDDEDDEEEEDHERPQKISLDNLVILFEQWKKALASDSPFIIFEEDEKGWITLRESYS